MATSSNYLPPALTADSITDLILALNLPKPTSIEPLEAAASFHSIYLINFSALVATDIPVRAEKDGTLALVLRVSGRQLPSIKTLNEVGVMNWVRKNTHIPVPAIVRYDATENNLIGHEFTLLEKAPGVSVDKIYDTLSTETKTKMSGYVGGLTLRDNGEIARGPLLDEYFWQLPDLEQYWSSPGMHETLDTLNPIAADGFPNYVSFNVACLERYIHAIEVHPLLDPYRDMVPRLRSFILALQTSVNIDELNRVAYVLAHKDMHFANIMCDPEEPGCPITAVLDWEFSGVVPAPRWNPPRAFLWNMKSTPEDKAEQTRMEELFEQVCHERGAQSILEETKMNAAQESMQTVVNHVRAIVEVCPRGQASDRTRQWRKVAEAAMEKFGV
ncbi:conserved hypothetical protein [Talaromyces stipitatus ATCC 10500]|uniref:Aminoglycoside phosphotransferase domain-containing protein n=1 Tax=Talaromyces stipitatus (strain ATCC 10500 / CBS 375.48 / QM 6759 / NRRL 1006) TaxID=441959 RepID=B8MNA9_TALSN|nr:uncharacterized protein TSTA_102280 [Talaromyces stipitatus ATCC 10500]EED13998.1 conserved hypothetical protein [Talaromyces stipitatus ATCC 10500]